MVTHKLVAIINKEIEIGVAMNALAHTAIGLGAQLDKQVLQLDDYKDSDSNVYPNISRMPFIILKGKSNEIRKALSNAKAKSIAYGVFINTMTGGTYVEQLANTAQTSESILVYYVLVLFGEKDIVNGITKSFSLYR